MAPGLLTYKGIVYPWHCDHMGHMNVMWYVGKFDEATWALVAYLGLDAQALARAGRGMAALEQHITYQREAVAGDQIEVYSSLLDIQDKTLKFRHNMYDVISGDIAATSEIIGLYMDTSVRKGTPLPDAVRGAAQKMLGDGAD